MLRWLYLQQKAVAFRAQPPHRESRASLQALKNLIAEADLILETCPPLPENRTAACREALRAALALTDDLLKHSRMDAAALLGHKGGSVIARKLGVEHYRKMAATRKTHRGGRPRKEQWD